MLNLLGRDTREPSRFEATLFVAGFSLEESSRVIEDLRTAGGRCSNHPSYSGHKKPETDCPDCLAIFEARQRLESVVPITGDWARGTLLDRDNRDTPRVVGELADSQAPDQPEPAVSVEEVIRRKADDLTASQFKVSRTWSGYIIVDQVGLRRWFFGDGGDGGLLLKRSVELAGLLGVGCKGYRVVPEALLRQIVENALGNPGDEYAHVPMKAVLTLAELLGIKVRDDAAVS